MSRIFFVFFVILLFGLPVLANVSFCILCSFPIDPCNEVAKGLRGSLKGIPQVWKMDGQIYFSNLSALILVVSSAKWDAVFRCAVSPACLVFYWDSWEWNPTKPNQVAKSDRLCLFKLKSAGRGLVETSVSWTLIRLQSTFQQDQLSLSALITATV